MLHVGNHSDTTLRISPQYLRMFEDAATDPALREMLKKKIGSARWLIDAIRQRQETLLRVVREHLTRAPSQ